MLTDVKVNQLVIICLNYVFIEYILYCEISACKILAVELENRLQETGKTSDVLEIGYSVDDVKPKKRKKYEKSLVLHC